MENKVEWFLYILTLSSRKRAAVLSPYFSIGSPFANQAQANSSQKQIPVLPGRLSGVYRLHQLSFPSGPFSSALTSALPSLTCSSANTMKLTEVSGNKDIHVFKAVWNEWREGSVPRSVYSTSPVFYILKLGFLILWDSELKLLVCETTVFRMSMYGNSSLTCPLHHFNPSIFIPPVTCRFATNAAKEFISGSDSSPYWGEVRGLGGRLYIFNRYSTSSKLLYSAPCRS